MRWRAYDERRDSLGTSARAPRALETLGALPERARLGHGARRLFAPRHGVGLPAARPRALEGLPLGRRRAGRHLGPPPAHLLCRRVVERARPDLERAAVRTDRLRGKPR